MLYQATDGTVYGGDRQQRPDGIFDPEIPDRPSVDYEWNGSSWVLPPKPADWQGLAETFNFPGNGLYGAIYSAIKAANSSDVFDHWGNFKLMLLTPSLQSPEALAAGITYLVFLLSQAGQAIPLEAKNEWNALVSRQGFPESCQLK